MHPFGWDAFGLPAENAAIAHNTSPQSWTKQNIATMRSQIEAMNIRIDSKREISTNDPEYYRWTQWFFVQMFKRGVAYQKEGQVNYDPVDQTVVANEQIDKNGRAWRSGAKVESRQMRQWYIKITDYAEEMMKGIESSGMPDKAKAIQRDWISKIHDWCISRQRYWGTPIPVVHCPHCGTVHVPEEQLPVTFPEVVGDWSDYRQQIEEWKQTPCPVCGRAATRETDTMDTFVDSAWYYYRYADPHNNEQPFSREAAAKWMPMSVYIGGIEHANAHVVYGRFFSRFIKEIGLADNVEPFERYIPIGIVQGETFRNPKTGRYIRPGDPTNPVDPETGEECERIFTKMSKSKANGVSPAEIFDKYGADVVRIHIAFKAPVEKDMVWDTQGIKGIQRFVRRVEGFTRSHSQDRDPQMQSAFEKFTRGFESDMEQFALNTAIAKMMAFSRQVARFQDSKEKDCAISYVQEVAKVFTGEG